MSPDALRDSLIVPTAATAIATWVRPQDLAGCVDCTTTVDLAEVCAVTQEILFVLSGRRYAQRRVNVRPHRLVETSLAWSWSPFGWNSTGAGGMSGWAAGQSLDDPDRYALTLAGPVQAVNQVKIDGTIIPISGYALFNGHTLVRVDDHGGGARLAWPYNQRLDLPDTAIGTFAIDYTWGASIPRGGQVAARAYACQLASLLAGGDCTLPSRVTQLARQGVTMTRLDPFEFLEKGKTGVEVVDAWLAAVNPLGRRRRATIVSPDTLQGARSV